MRTVSFRVALAVCAVWLTLCPGMLYADEETDASGSSESSADGTDSSTNDRGFCEHFIGNPSMCSRQPGCFFDYRSSRCMRSGGGGGGGGGYDNFNICSRFNYDYRSCVNSGCLFDGRTGFCFSSGSPNLDPYTQPYPNPIHGPGYGPNPGPGPYPDHGPSPYPGTYPGSYPGFGRMACYAYDAGFEEHRRGHVGYGQTRDEAYYNAMRLCLNLHGDCRVRECRMQYQ